MRRILLFVPFLLLGLIAGDRGGAVAEPAAPPPAAFPGLPGIAGPDPFPEACVGCHVRMPELDARLATLMQGWNESVDAALVAKVQGVMPEGVTLKGKHPSVTRALADVPAACIRCHKASSKAPPFAPMVHVLHLTGGADNHFVAEFGGTCTLCHKLDAKSGVWSVPSGGEKEELVTPPTGKR